MTPKRGDLVRVDWVDICSDATGDPADANLARRQTFGIYREHRSDDDVRAVVISMTIDEDTDEQSGWWIFPESCVQRIAVIKRSVERDRGRPDS